MGKVFRMTPFLVALVGYNTIKIMGFCLQKKTFTLVLHKNMLFLFDNYK